MSPTTQKLIIGLICLVPLLVIFNVALFGMLKQKSQAPGKNPMPRLDIPFRNPWRKEDNQLSELSQRVSGLPPSPSSGEGHSEDHSSL